MLLLLNFDAILIQSKSLNSLGKMANSSRLFSSFRIRAIPYVSFWNGNCKQRDILMIESMNSLSRQVSIRSEGTSTKYWSLRLREAGWLAGGHLATEQELEPSSGCVLFPDVTSMPRMAESFCPDSAKCNKSFPCNTQQSPWTSTPPTSSLAGGHARSRKRRGRCWPQAQD